MESKGLSKKMQKITLQARLAERVRVLSIILCASVTGLGNCTKIPFRIFSWIYRWMILLVHLKISIYPFNYIRPF